MRFAGDIITAVDGSSCLGLSIREITRLILGYTALFKGAQLL
jgi:hypothetical protein